MFSYINKLAPYTKRYKHAEDCHSSGCPGHIAKFEIAHVSELYFMDFANRSICLDGEEMELLIDFIENASDKKLRDKTDEDDKIIKLEARIKELEEEMEDLKLEHRDALEVLER